MTRPNCLLDLLLEIRRIVYGHVLRPSPTPPPQRIETVILGEARLGRATLNLWELETQLKALELRAEKTDVTTNGNRLLLISTG